MSGGVAVRDFQGIVGDMSMQERFRIREGQKEIYFLLSDPERVLPVYVSGGTQVVQWGARRAQWKRLPPAACRRWEDLEVGRLNVWNPEPVVISASRAMDNVIWFDVVQGVHAVAVRDGQATVVPPRLEPASHYYRGMTGSEWMPCLVRQRL